MDTQNLSPDSDLAQEATVDSPLAHAIAEGTVTLVQPGTTPGKTVGLESIETQLVQVETNSQPPAVDVEQEFTLEGMDDLPEDQKAAMVEQLRAKVVEMQQSGHGLQLGADGQVGFNPGNFGRVDPIARDVERAKRMSSTQLLALAAGLGVAGLTNRTRDGLILPDWMVKEVKTPPRQVPKSLAERQAEQQRKQDIANHNAAISAQRDVERQQAKELRKARKQVKRQAKAMGR